MHGALGGGGGSSWSPQQLERGEHGFIWRGLGVVSFEVPPLWAESMGNSTAHLSCPNLIHRPGSQFGVRGRLRRETASQRASLRLICRRLTGRSDDKKSERRAAERRGSRKRSADSESDKKDEARGV